jgi:hypothetical protein
VILVALKDRESGYQFSSIEKELAFNRENTGFVRHDKRSKIRFNLDPSPFYPNPRNEVFVAANCPLPPEGKMVEVSVVEKQKWNEESSDNYTKGTTIGFKTVTIKYIDSWKEVNPNSFSKRRALLRGDEFIDFFSRQYRSRFGMVEDVAECTALCALSSPQFLYERGGISASMLGNKKQWDAFNRSLGFIPRELRKNSSPYQYAISYYEKMTSSQDSKEINCLFHEPKETHVHIAVPFEFEMQGKKYQWYQDEAPLMRGFMIDSLLIEPDIPDRLVKKVTDAYYAIEWEYAHRGEAAYKMDMGSCISRICLALARLGREDRVENTNIDEGVDLIVDMHKLSFEVGSKRSLNKKLDDISVPARTLFMKLADVYDYDTNFDIVEAQKEMRISPSNFTELFMQLKTNGYVYFPSKDSVKLIDFRVPKRNEINDEL